VSFAGPFLFESAMTGACGSCLCYRFFDDADAETVSPVLPSNRWLVSEEPTGPTNTWKEGEGEKKE
jgi:hypothetical protein